jgi:hypothetical protein
MVMISTQVSELELEDFQGKITQNVVLPNVSWQTYKALLADMSAIGCDRLGLSSRGRRDDKNQLLKEKLHYPQ